MHETAWVVGAGGMLGAALASTLAEKLHHVGPPIDWRGDAEASIAAATAHFVASAQRASRWAVFWCAGAGIIGTSDEVLARETRLLDVLLSGLPNDGRGVLVLASSAGGVYGGSQNMPVSEFDAAHPISSYGRNKLLQEDHVRDWANRSGNRAVIARIANLYGPGQSLGKRQGLISQICLATLTRRPIPIYVSLDTLRDYIYVDDCAKMMLSAADRVVVEPSGSAVRKIIATGASVSIGAILAETRRVLRRRVSYTTSSSSLSSQQGSVVAFRTSVWRDLIGPLTPLPVGIHNTAEDLRRQLQSGQVAD